MTIHSLMVLSLLVLAQSSRQAAPIVLDDNPVVLHPSNDRSEGGPLPTAPSAWGNGDTVGDSQLGRPQIEAHDDGLLSSFVVNEFRFGRALHEAAGIAGSGCQLATGR